MGVEAFSGSRRCIISRRFTLMHADGRVLLPDLVNWGGLDYLDVRTHYSVRLDSSIFGMDGTGFTSPDSAAAQQPSLIYRLPVNGLPTINRVSSRAMANGNGGGTYYGCCLALFTFSIALSKFNLTSLSRSSTFLARSKALTAGSAQLPERLSTWLAVR